MPESAGPSPTAANRHHYRICQGARRIFGWVIYRPLDLPILHMRRSFYVSFPTPILHITLYRKYAITSSHNQICFHINSTFAKHQGYDDARCTAAERPATQAVQVRWQSCGRFFFFSFFTKKLPPNTHDGAEPRAGLELPKGFRLGFGLFQGSVTSGFGLLQGSGYFMVRDTSGFGLVWVTAVQGWLISTCCDLPVIRIISRFYAFYCSDVIKGRFERYFEWVRVRVS